MLGQSYFQLLGPLTFLVFSGGFLVLWQQTRDMRSLLWFSGSYFLGAAAMFGDFLRIAMNPDFASAFLSVLYLAATILFCAGLYALHGKRPPFRGIAVSALALLALFSWLRYGVKDMALCTWVINGGNAAYYLFAIYHLRDRMTHRIDRAMQALLVASALLMMVRTGLVLWYEGATMPGAGYNGSLEAVTLQLLIAVSALAAAGVLFARYVADIVRRLTVTGETDPLTGLLNRRGFEARLGAIAATSAKRNGEHAVIIADLDRFKAVNDTHGHDAGDEVIRSFARLLSEFARDCDLVVRWGGEEFLVLVANADAVAARLFAEAVRTRWESLRHDSLGGETVTASFGIACWCGGQDVSAAIERADKAVYRAKREGRNRVLLLAPEAVGEDAFAADARDRKTG